MFYTLKSRSQADDPYSFETTAPPFSKKREGTLTKVACIHCRMSKLKCSGEPHSCQRCVAKQLECRYPRPSRSHTQRGTPPSLSEAPQRTPPPSVAMEGATDDDFIAVASNQGSTNSGSLNDSSLSLEMPDFATSTNMNMSLSDSEYMAPQDMMGPWDQQQQFTFAASTSKAFWNDGPELEGFDVNAGDRTCNPTGASSVAKMEGNCSCLARVVGTHEAIEVALWSQKKLSRSADNMLQRQKKLLLECEGLLECQKCSALPAYVMLLISMCSRLLETFEDIRRDDPTTGSKEAVKATMAVHFPEDRKRKNGSDGGNGDDGRQRYGVNIRSGELDDDDERLVLQSLLKARVTRLECLLSTLDTVVSQHSWPAHAGLLREMQHRLSRVSVI